MKQSGRLMPAPREGTRVLRPERLSKCRQKQWNRTATLALSKVTGIINYKNRVGFYSESNSFCTSVEGWGSPAYYLLYLSVKSGAILKS